jgi:outer membrane immunogenic protein
MWRMLVTGVAVLSAIAANTSFAADMSAPAYRAAPMPPPTVNWTGCYGGLQAGGVADFTNFQGSGTFGAGPQLGGQVGCNYQISGFVFGVEGDGTWVDANANNASGTTGALTTNSTKNRWDADLTLRTGFAWDNYLVYNKLGAAWGGFDFTQTLPGTTLSASATLPGFIEGIGAEYMISQHWSAKLEFDVSIFDAQTLNLSCAGVCGVATSTSPMLFELGGRVGANYRF